MFVFRQNPVGQPEKITVQLGATSLDVVEIRSGLAAGDLIATDARSVD